MIPKSILEKISLKQSGKIHLIDLEGSEVTHFYMRMGELLSELNDEEFSKALNEINFEDIKWVFAPENLPMSGLYLHSWRSFIKLKSFQKKKRSYKKHALMDGEDLSYQEFQWLCQFLRGCKIEVNQIKILMNKGYII